MRERWNREILWGALWLFAAGACAEGDPNSPGVDPLAESSRATQDGIASTELDTELTSASENSPMEAYLQKTDEMGLTRYKGKLSPIEFSFDPETETTTYTFDPEEGPQCMRGDPFLTGIRQTESDDLVIFLQGGGACWSVFCLAVTGAMEGVPPVDILNPELKANPTRDWNAVYVPYCDGSFFAGDAEIDDNLNGKGKRIHRGLANLTGAFEVAAFHVPSPRRVLLAGSSGGAYGLLLGGPLLRHYFPEAELYLMADSGIGLARTADAEYITLPLEEFKAEDFVPAECEDCIVSGHLTPLVGWMLDQDPGLRVGMYSSWYDGILAAVFLQIPWSDFADALKTQSDALAKGYPDRFRRFITDGTQHTALIGDASGVIGTDITKLEYPEDALSTLVGGTLVLGRLETTEVDGVSLATWLQGMLENDAEVWVDRIEPRGPEPE